MITRSIPLGSWETVSFTASTGSPMARSEVPAGEMGEGRFPVTAPIMATSSSPTVKVVYALSGEVACLLPLRWTFAPS